MFLSLALSMMPLMVYSQTNHEQLGVTLKYSNVPGSCSSIASSAQKLQDITCGECTKIEGVALPGDLYSKF